jgi:hypothetical protein
MLDRQERSFAKLAVVGGWGVSVSRDLTSSGSLCRDY